jgi:DNA-binding CsgD family transcriptional regulator
VAVEYTTLGDTERALSLNQRALELVGNDPNSTAFFLAHAQLLDHYTQFRWDPAKAEEHVQLAAQATGQPSIGDRIDFLESRSILAVGQGHAQTALELTREAVGLATGSGDFRRAVRCWGTFAANATLAGEVVLAFEGFDNALKIMSAKSIAGLTGNWTRVYLAYATYYRGDLERSRQIVEELLSSGIEMKSFLIHLAGAGIPIGLALEDDDLVRRCAREQLVDAALQSSSVTVLDAMSAFAEFFEAHNELEKATSLMHRVLEALEPIRDVVAWDAHRLFVTFARIGDIDDLPRVRKVFERAVKSSNVPSNAPHVALFDAFAAARQGDKNAAGAAASAATGFRHIGWPLHEAQALELAGRAKEACDIYQRVGDVRNTKRLQAKVMPVNRQGRRSDQPTPREREILELIVSGKSNRSIAQALVISERTVEDHISSILSKLGVSRRSELIARYKPSGKSEDGD